MSQDEQPQTHPRFRAMLEETLFPSPNSVEFARTPQNDYQLRFSARFTHIAELFQENTKLVPYSTLRASDYNQETSFQLNEGERFSPRVIEMMNQDFHDARKWYFSTAYRMRESDIIPENEHMLRIRASDLPQPLANIFRPFAFGEPINALPYSVDIVLLYAGRLLRLVPGADILWVMKELQPGEHDVLRASLLSVPRAMLKQASAYIFFVGAPWRYMMFYGPRGYRHMLFEAGALMKQCQFLAGQQGFDTSVCLDFYDARVDQVLLLDGAERTTLGVMAMCDSKAE